MLVTSAHNSKIQLEHPIENPKISNTYGPKIYISVIIIAYNRSNYIKAALDSVLNQSIERSKYEIIVVKNFKDSYIDNLKIDNFLNITVENNDESPFGINLWRYGFSKSSGDIICFLEDDDIFYPNKLFEVVKAFSEYPSVGYIHNVFTITIDFGQNIGHKFQIKYPIPNSTRLIRRRELRKNYNDLIKYNVDAHLSSINVKRQVLLPFEGKIPNVPGGFDGLVFYFFLASDLDLLIYNKPLNTYRLHQKNNSKPKTYTELLFYLSRLEISAKMMLPILKETDFEDIANADLLYWSVKKEISESIHRPKFRNLLIVLITLLKLRSKPLFYLALIYIVYFFTNLSYYKFVNFKSVME